MATETISDPDADIIGGTPENQGDSSAGVTEVTEVTPSEKSPDIDLSKSMDKVSSTEMVDERGRTTKVETTPPKTEESQDTKKVQTKPKLSDFDKIISDNTGLEKLVEKKEEKVSEKKEEVGVKTETTAATAKPEKVETDLTGFGEQQQIWLRRMPSDAREHFAKKLREERELKETIKGYEEKVKNLTVGKEVLPESYYEHPRAFELSSEYQNATRNINTSVSIYNHWLAQKNKIESGEDWQDLEDEVGADGKFTGNIIVKDPEPTTTAAKVHIDEMLNGARMQIQQFKATAANLAENFKVNHIKHQENIRSLAQKYYPQFEDKNYEGYKTLEKVVEELPKVGINKTNSIFELFARSVALNYIYVNYIKNNLTKTQVKEEIKKEAAKAGPTSSSFSGGGSGTSKNSPDGKKVSLADFNKILG